MEVAKKAENLLAVGEQLCKILEQENIAIERRAYAVVSGTLDAKDRLSRAYEKLTQALIDPPGQFEELSEDVRNQAREVVGRLEALTLENTRKLKVQIKANECVIKHVANAAKDATNSTASYNRYGTCTPRAHSGAPVSKTVSYDRVL